MTGKTWITLYALFAVALEKSKNLKCVNKHHKNNGSSVHFLSTKLSMFSGFINRQEKSLGKLICTVHSPKKIQIPSMN